METKICRMCEQEKPLSEFYKSKYYASRCKECNKKYCKEYAKTGYYVRYERNYSKQPRVLARINLKKKEYRQDPLVKLKNSARTYVHHKIRAGKINKENCAMCGESQTQIHHPDYNRPLLIVWLCDKCHRKLHKNLKANGREERKKIYALA